MLRLSKKLLDNQGGGRRFGFRHVSGTLIGLFLLWLIPSSIETVPAGHVKVGTLFGRVQDASIAEGLHFVNPLMQWRAFDCRQKTAKIDGSSMPSNDQLTTSIDWSIQYRADCSMAAQMLRETGTVQEVVTVHLTPNFRSLIREKGKGVARAEDYFSEEVQARLQDGVLTDLAEIVGSKGITVSGTLLRNVKLPPVIATAIESKKERQQEAEKQQAELERFRIEQEQKIAQAEVERKAAELEAQKIRTLAEAEAAANRIVAASLTNSLVEYRAIERWEGKLPTVTGGAVPFIDLRSGGK